MGHQRLILASGSSGRRWLLEQAGLDFEVIVSQVEEPTSGFSDPSAFVQSVAWAKGRAVASKITTHEKTLVLAADTIGWLENRALLKPDDIDHARQMLSSMAGKVHELWTGVILWVIPGNIQIQWQERSLVKISSMTARDIDAYLEQRIWRGCSGGYAIQGPDDPIVQIIDGTISNVVGLPMESLVKILAGLGTIG